MQVNGANALANLYLDTIFGNATGVNIQSGGVAKTLGNNDFGNGNDCTVAGTPTACSTVLTERRAAVAGMTPASPSDARCDQSGQCRWPD